MSATIVALGIVALAALWALVLRPASWDVWLRGHPRRSWTLEDANEGRPLPPPQLGTWGEWAFDGLMILVLVLVYLGITCIACS